jgi:Raf kinase inhibitor-like YbhB/YbcL family protein
MNRPVRALLFTILILPLLLAACAPTPVAMDAMPEPTVQAAETEPPAPFTLTSPAFADGGDIAAQYSYSMGGQCTGENLQPPLAWSGTPAGTQSLALTMIDPDGANWVHWVHFNIPPEVTGLPEGPGGPDGGPALGVKGLNHFGESGYGGPCPPGSAHRYVFTLFALDTMLTLNAGATNAQLTIAMNGHILGQAQLTGVRAP